MGSEQSLPSQHSCYKLRALAFQLPAPKNKYTKDIRPLRQAHRKKLYQILLKNSGNLQWLLKHSSPDFTRTDSFLDLFSLISLSLEVKSSSRVKIFYHCNLVTTIYTICPKFSHYSCHSQLFTGNGTCSFRGNLQITTNWCAANCGQWALEQNWSAV